MHYIILLFAIFLVFAGALILVKPAAVFGLLDKHSGSLSVHIIAVVLRVLLGIWLLVVAPSSKFPLILAILGVISLIAGITLAVVGRERFIKLMDWMIKIMRKSFPVLGIVAILFGGFLAYAVI